MWMQSLSLDFSDDVIEKLKYVSEHGELEVYSDRTCDGLQLVVASGLKSFQFVVKAGRHGASGLVHLGNFPSRSTEEARALAVYLALIPERAASVGPPSTTSIDQRVWTFALCAEAYLASRLEEQQNDFMPDKRVLRETILGRGYERADRHFFFDRRWTQKPVGEVGSDEVSAFVRRIREVYGSGLARRCLSIVKATFALAANPSHHGVFGLEHDPVAALGEELVQMEISLQWFDAARLRSYLHAADRLSPQDRALAKVLVLTGLPGKSLAKWRWATLYRTVGGYRAYYDFILSDAVWSLLDELRASTAPAADDLVSGTKRASPRSSKN